MPGSCRINPRHILLAIRSDNDLTTYLSQDAGVIPEIKPTLVPTNKTKKSSRAKGIEGSEGVQWRPAPRPQFRGLFAFWLSPMTAHAFPPSPGSPGMTAVTKTPPSKGKGIEGSEGVQWRPPPRPQFRGLLSGCP